MKKFLEEGIKRLEMYIDEKQVEKLLIYGKLLIETNKHTNLTAIRDEESMYDKHFLDSMLVHKLIPAGTTNAIDIGTGAGFPGMVLAILNPQIKFTLLDSVGKKTKFLEEVAKELKLENVEVINDRAEIFIKENRRETYDLGLCRGVSKINVILEYMIPFLKVNATFLAQKQDYAQELSESENAFKELKSKIIGVHNFKLPYSGDDRTIFEMKKLESTPEKYPRRTGIPLKRPL